MSERTSLSHPSVVSPSTDCDNSDVTDNALSQEIRTQSLASLVKRFESSDESLSWTILMEWFVEAVIGAELFRNEHPSAPPLTSENIRIDSSSTIVIAFPCSPDEPSLYGSLSSDISTLCKFFLHIHRTLEQLNRLILPLDNKQLDIVFSRIMVALVEHFVASGNLILPNSSPTDLSPDFAEHFLVNYEKDLPFSNPFLVHKLSASFTHQSFLRGNDVEYSEDLLDAVKKIKETHSLETVQNAFFDWTEWVKMMEVVKQRVFSLSDLSFLQSRCLRATLLSLQTKHQLRANPLRIEETNETESSSNEISTSTRLSSVIDVTWNLMNVSSSGLSSAISTQTSLPSEQSSSDSQLLTSDQLVFHADSIAHHSRQILSAIHGLLTRPSPTSFPWDIRPSDISESFLDAHFQPTPQFVNRNEKFEISLFDEADDRKVVASLRRCHAVLEATQSTECIVELHAFQTFLISGLRSSNNAIQSECHNLINTIGDLLRTVDDPRDSQFQSLRKALRDGTYCEKITLLNLWVRWLQFQSEIGPGEMMTESDFDFGGLLATDLSDTILFDFACFFVCRVFVSDAVSLSFRWKMDFLLSFEKRHQMMSRLSSDPISSSKQEPSTLFLSAHAIVFGAFLSVFRGCDFPSALTEVITIDLDSSPQKFFLRPNAAYLLSHTSIAPKHRRSFFPMDLMFERYLRSDPDAFFRNWPDVKHCTSRKFLRTPSVGLHSLLLRHPTLNLSQQALLLLMKMLSLDLSSEQDSTLPIIHTLFNSFPPPRLLDTLLSSPHLVRATFDIWTTFLVVFYELGDCIASFGACSSLAKVFKMLVPFGSSLKQLELDLLGLVGESVVSLHWLSVPGHFDSPLLCHLPSLAGAQRGILQTLPSHSGIPSLLIPLRILPDWNTIRTIKYEALTFIQFNRILSLCVRHLASDVSHSSTVDLFVIAFLSKTLLSPFPSVASAAFEFFHRFVSVSSDAVRMKLVKRDLLDHVVFAVSNSSFLDDYEKGIAVIGILLATIRRVEQKRRLRVFDFDQCLNTHPRRSSSD
ncbi:hypothetical protein BLNAU_10867 [Blattamonas nauphoetae]|uniref:Uncharacterized protein n=1 Tax=Blattamonas nauphoetae TaxID=2049346 RepID=A0ABQ9XRL9_9EUKA|nr:hypothetical protein BLNAU_10867 [Blattamonas nauphoetae]